MKTYKLKNIRITKEELQKLIDKNPELREKHGLWKPEVGDTYYNIDGMIIPSSWRGDLADNKRHETGNVYRTEEEAENELEKLKAIQRVKEFIALEFGVVEPDWGDSHQDKLSLFYSYGFRAEFKIEGFGTAKMYSPIGYLRTIEDCKKLIAEKADDLKIIWGIE